MCCVGGAEADWLAAVLPKVFSDSSDQRERDRECEKEDVGKEEGKIRESVRKRKREERR